MSEQSDKTLKDRAQEVLRELSKEEQVLLAGVVKAERDKLHLKLPRNINDDLWKVLTEVIK
jgi:tartrate dehydratase beta subunit/fumarate hydratase class I family protein